MNRPLTKIILIIFVVILLPLIGFTVYQLSSISENEEVLQEIYSNQLESILFSVNQHSDDVVSSWAGTVERHLLTPDKAAEKLAQFANDFPPIEGVFVFSPRGQNIPVFKTLSPAMNKDTISGRLSEALKANSTAVSKLEAYYKSGFRKIESMEITDDNNLIILLFVVQGDGKENNLAGMVIDKRSFISEVISRRIGRTAGDKFTLAVLSDIRDSIVYSNFPIKPEEIDRKKELWVLKGYSLGISLKGETLNQVIGERGKRTLYILLLVNLLFISGMVLVIINIRRQIRLAQIKSDFVSNVSHELRTPLALITMFAETLEAGRVKSEDKVKEYYKIISTEANRLSKIVNSILNFSQMESGKRKYSFRESSLNEVVEKVAETYTFHLKNKGFQFRMDLSQDLPAVSADPDSLSEATINLLDNAIKYSSEVKEIVVSTGVLGKMVFISVRDKGVGIASGEIRQIFDKFYRVTSGLTHNTKGTGLGLTIVKHIIDAHKGKIEVKSTPGEGSEFILLLPQR